MGCCAICDSDPIKAEIQRDRDISKKVKKILFLGAGGSGKSTLFKQLRGLHGSQYTDTEIVQFRNSIFSQAIDEMKEAVKSIEFMNEEEEYDVEDMKLLESSVEASNYLNDVPNLLTKEVADAISTLWKDPAIKLVYENRATLKISDSCEYFWNNIYRLSAPNYSPTEEDILLFRARTTGVHEERFTIKGTPFLIVDVGGQRSERRKWFSCFDAVTAVIFVASLNAYDEKLFEDLEVSSMMDQIELFDSIINNPSFESISMILFLNKQDLFAEKIQRIPLTACWPDYAGDGSFEDTTSFITDRFEERNRNSSRHIFTHITNAIDKNNVDKVFGDVQHVIISSSLASGGLLDAGPIVAPPRRIESNQAQENIREVEREVQSQSVRP